MKLDGKKNSNSQIQLSCMCSSCTGSCYAHCTGCMDHCTGCGYSNVVE